MTTAETFYAAHWSEYLRFDPHAGVFYFLQNPTGHFHSESQKKRWITLHAGAEAGALTWHGYVRITLRGHMMLAHRLAWFIAHREWPEITDHVDRNKTNNRLSNLRSCTPRENNFNRSSVGGRSPYKGVTAYKRWWKASIKLAGVHLHLGLFPTQVEAATVYDAAARVIQGDFAVLNFPHREAA